VDLPEEAPAAVVRGDGAAAVATSPELAPESTRS